MQARFQFLLALKSIIYFRKRIALVLFGIIFALSLLFANSIWEDTSEILVINELVENTDYLASTSSFLPGRVTDILEYLPEDDNIESFDISILSNAIFNFEDKDETYRYFPLDNQEDPSNPVEVSNAIVTNLEAMDNLDAIFNVNGSMPDEHNEILISRDLANDLEDLLEIDIVPGVQLNVSIAKKFPFTDIGEFQLVHFSPNYYYDFTLTGIIEYNGAASITEVIYTDQVFNRLVVFPLTEETFTINNLAEMDRNSLIANLMISIRTEKLIEFGVENLENYLFNFQERLKSRFWFSVNKVQTRTAEDLRNEFVFSFNSSSFYIPLVILSLLLTHYTIGLLINGREGHFNILRLRGTNDQDIIKILAIEFGIIGIIAFIAGSPLSILLASLIPGLRPDGSIDMETVRLFFQKMQFEFASLYLIILVVLGAYLLSIFYHTYNLIQKSNPTYSNGRAISFVTRYTGNFVLGLDSAFNLWNHSN